MVATNSVAQKNRNISAGTSVFAMIVLDRALSRVYPEIDLVATPSGEPVAMVHCNTCTSDIDAWAGLFENLRTPSALNRERTRFTGFFTRRLGGRRRLRRAAFV
jgi:hypothetical protein